MTYADCLSYLEKIQDQGIKFGLENVRAILDFFDNPHRKFPSVLVAGSNGKGSVCAMLTSILTLQGFRAGLYTSPHLVSPEERIRVGARPIPEADFCALIQRLKAGIERLIDENTLEAPPTYFEFMTCLAFLYFAEKSVDISVLEVGMGGRFDATNVVQPVISVITTISAEHQQYLGRTLSRIAFEKAGIIKPGVPVICGERKKSARETILSRAGALGAPFVDVFPVRGSLKRRKTQKGYVCRFRSSEDDYEFTAALPGAHQCVNAAVAVVSSEHLSRLWRPVKKDSIIRGIETVKWDGRLEIISYDPLILLDGAHNEAGARALRAYLGTFVQTERILVFAAMRDKKIERMADILFPLAGNVILT